MCEDDPNCYAFEFKAGVSCNRCSKKPAYCNMFRDCYYTPRNGAADTTQLVYDASWDVFIKDDYYSQTDLNDAKRWRLNLPGSKNYNVRKVVLRAPQDDVGFGGFNVDVFESAPVNIATDAGSPYHTFERKGTRLHSGNDWMNTLSGGGFSRPLNRIEIRAHPNPTNQAWHEKGVRLAQVEVYIKEVVPSLPTKDEYHAAILSAMQSRVNQVGAELQACYSRQCG